MMIHVDHVVTCITCAGITCASSTSSTYYAFTCVAFTCVAFTCVTFTCAIACARFEILLRRRPNAVANLIY
jgi:hypothetical protein